MTSKPKPAPLPRVLTSEPESNHYLAKFKSSLARRWSLTRMNELFDECDFLVFLIALGRTDDAQEVASALTAIPFTGNYNIRTPVGYAVCLQARLFRLAGNKEAWAAAMARIREHPVEKPDTEFTQYKLDSVSINIRDAAVESSTKWACHYLAMAVSTACYYCEAARAGIDQGLSYDAEAVETLLLEGLRQLRERLEVR